MSDPAPDEIVRGSLTAIKLQQLLARDAGLNPASVINWSAHHDGGDDVMVSFEVDHFMTLAQFNEYVAESRL